MNDLIGGMTRPSQTRPGGLPLNYGLDGHFRGDQPWAGNKGGTSQAGPGLGGPPLNPLPGQPGARPTFWGPPQPGGGPLREPPRPGGQPVNIMPTFQPGTRPNYATRPREQRGLAPPGYENAWNNRPPSTMPGRGMGTSPLSRAMPPQSGMGGSWMQPGGRGGSLPSWAGPASQNSQYQQMMGGPAPASTGGFGIDTGTEQKEGASPLSQAFPPNAAPGEAQRRVMMDRMRGATRSPVPPSPGQFPGSAAMAPGGYREMMEQMRRRMQTQQGGNRPPPTSN